MMLRGIESQTPSLTSATATPQPVRNTASSGFAERLGGAVAEMADSVGQAENTAVSMTSGGADSIETILSLSRAELALRHVVSVRNRLLEAYQDVMRMPL
jgi:flagellar hook-basal body complex protein FliE